MKRLIVKHNDIVIDMAEGETEGLQDFLSRNIKEGKYPEGFTYTEEDMTAEHEAKKAKEKKKKEFQFKGTTIAALRAELNEYFELKS